MAQERIGKTPFKDRLKTFGLAASPPAIASIPGEIYLLSQGDFQSAKALGIYFLALHTLYGLNFYSDFKGEFTPLAKARRKTDKARKKWLKENMKPLPLSS